MSNITFRELLDGLFLDFIDDQETTLNLMMYLNDIDEVSGDALVQLARKVGVSLQTLEEAKLRVLIRGKIGARMSDGTTKDMDDIFKSVTGGHGYLKEHAPNNIQFYVDEDEIDYEDVILQYLRQAKALGVVVQGIVLIPTNGFMLDESELVETAAVSGDVLVDMEV